MDQIIPQPLMFGPSDHCQPDRRNISQRPLQRGVIHLRWSRRRNVIAAVRVVGNARLWRWQCNEALGVRHKKVTAWENASNLRNCWTQVSHMYNMQGHGLAVKNTGAPCDRGGGG